MNNLHISLTEFRNESRVLKEATSIASLEGVGRVYIAALGAEDQRENETYGEAIEARRFRLSTRGLSKGLLAQGIKYLEFALRVGQYYSGKHIRLINVHSLGLLPLGCLLKVLYRAKLIYDTHELETETHGLRGRRKKLLKWIERVLITRADHVCVVSENIADWYATAYEIARPTVIMNAPRLQTPAKSDRFRNKFGIRPDQIIVLYQGLLSSGRGVELLLSAFAQRADDAVVVIFMGYGELAKNIEEVAERTNRVFLHRAVSPAVVLEFTAAADIGISLFEHTCLSYYYVMPNKLFEYAMAGLPVIVSDMKELGEFVDRYRMGIVVKGADVASINQSIDSMRSKDLETMRENARKAAKENSWEVQERKLLDVYRLMDCRQNR